MEQDIAYIVLGIKEIVKLQNSKFSIYEVLEQSLFLISGKKKPE